MARKAKSKITKRDKNLSFIDKLNKAWMKNEAKSNWRPYHNRLRFAGVHFSELKKMFVGEDGEEYEGFHRTFEKIFLRSKLKKQKYEDVDLTDSDEDDLMDDDEKQKEKNNYLKFRGGSITDQQISLFMDNSGEMISNIDFSQETYMILKYLYKKAVIGVQAQVVVALPNSRCATAIDLVCWNDKEKVWEVYEIKVGYDGVWENGIEYMNYPLQTILATNRNAALIQAAFGAYLLANVIGVNMDKVVPYVLHVDRTGVSRYASNIQWGKIMADKCMQTAQYVQ